MIGGYMNDYHEKINFTINHDKKDFTIDFIC